MLHTLQFAVFKETDNSANGSMHYYHTNFLFCAVFFSRFNFLVIYFLFSIFSENAYSYLRNHLNLKNKGIIDSVMVITMVL